MSDTSDATGDAPGEARAGRAGLASAIWGGFVALQIGLAFAGQTGDGTGDRDAIYQYSTAVGGFVFSAFVIAIALAVGGLFRRPPDALGFRRFGLKPVLHAAGVIVVAIVVSVLLEPVLHAGEKQGLAPDEWQPDRVAAFALNTILFAVVGPFTEELFFRGLGVSVLRRLGIPVAIAATALLWGLAHGLPEALPPLLVLGVGFAWVRVTSGSIWPVVIAHGVYNAIGIAVSLAAT